MLLDEETRGEGFNMDNLQTMGIVNAMRTGDARLDMVRCSLCFISCGIMTIVLLTYGTLCVWLSLVDDRHVDPIVHSTFV